MHGHRSRPTERNLAWHQNLERTLGAGSRSRGRVFAARCEVGDELRRLFLEIAHSGILIRAPFETVEPYHCDMTHSSSARIRIAAGLTITVAALALAGCSSTSTTPITNYRGEPKGIEAPPSSAGGAPFSVWLKDGAQFTVTAYGSSTCPPVGTGFTVTGTNKITIDIKTYAKDKICTMDYVPHTTVFATPNEVDPHKDAKITVQDVRFTLRALSK